MLLLRLVLQSCPSLFSVEYCPWVLSLGPVVGSEATKCGRVALILFKLVVVEMFDRFA